MVIIYWGEQSQEVEQVEQVEVSTYQLMHSSLHRSYKLLIFLTCCVRRLVYIIPLNIKYEKYQSDFSKTYFNWHWNHSCNVRMIVC